MAEFSLEPAEVDALLRGAGQARDPAATAALTQFLALLGRWNRVHNLTGTRDGRELVLRHVAESLALQPWLHGTRIADIGSGAGFPGIPLAICTPERHFTLIESRAKRASFLRHAAATLGLANVEVAHSRAEDLPPAPPFATVLARAVAPPARLLDLVRPLLAPGGLLLLLTSAEHARGLRSPQRGFVPRPIEPPGGGLKSEIVRLERGVADTPRTPAEKHQR